MPTVSVVTSVFNGAEQLTESIDSILAQEGVDFEFIIVNDGSTDASARILEDFAARDSRLRLIHQPNQGLTKALIRGCAEARGEYIARQDVGDISLPGRFEKELALIQKDSSTVLVSCGTRFIGPKGEHLFDVQQRQDAATFSLKAVNLSTLQGPSHHGSTLFRKATYLKVGGYRPEFQMAQDIDLWVRLAEVGSHLVVPEVLYQAEYSLSGISAGRHQAQLWIGQMIQNCAAARRQGKSEQNFLEEVQKFSSEARTNKSKKNEAAYFIGMSLMRKNPEKAKEYFLLSLKENPLHLKSLIRLVGIYMARVE